MADTRSEDSHFIIKGKETMERVNTIRYMHNSKAPVKVFIKALPGTPWSTISYHYMPKLFAEVARTGKPASLTYYDDLEIAMGGERVYVVTVLPSAAEKMGPIAEGDGFFTSFSKAVNDAFDKIDEMHSGDEFESIIRLFFY